MSDTPKQVFFQSSNSSTSTLRPRQTRLISFLDDEDLSTADLQDRQQDGAGPSSIASSSTLGRSNSNVLNRKAEKPTQPRPISEANRLIPNAGLWDPWQSISGIASTLLGNDSHAQVKGKDKGAAKAPSWQKNNSTFTTRTAVPKWGRSLENTPRVTVSAAEERQATVQAKKREAMLLADTHEGPDLAGRYKRRGSDADFSKILSTSDSEQDALVYVHRIQPLDTLAGVMIKYSCQPEIFRRINRLWPNDNIQTRKHVFLPVDACTIRGKRIDNIGANLDLLNSQLENVSLTQEMGSDPNQKVRLSNPRLFHLPACTRSHLKRLQTRRTIDMNRGSSFPTFHYLPRSCAYLARRLDIFHLRVGKADQTRQSIQQRPRPNLHSTCSVTLQRMPHP